MDRVVQILMERDGMTKAEATDLLHEVQGMMRRNDFSFLF